MRKESKQDTVKFYTMYLVLKYTLSSSVIKESTLQLVKLKRASASFWSSSHADRGHFLKIFSYSFQALSSLPPFEFDWLLLYLIFINLITLSFIPLHFSRKAIIKPHPLSFYSSSQAEMVNNMVQIELQSPHFPLCRISIKVYSKSAICFTRNLCYIATDNQN